MNVRWPAAIFALLVLAVYLFCMTPGVFWRDSAEFAFIGHQMDISHPAGSPTFAMFSKLLSFFPLGSIAWRANLVSVLSAMAAVILLWLAAARWIKALNLGSGRLPYAIGACGALAFAFSRSFWEWSEAAEVYSMQCAALAGLLWLAAEILDDRTDARLFGLTGFILGLSCGAHMVQILYAPAFGLALLFAPRFRFQWRAAFCLGAFFIVGFSIFAYLPVRSLTGLPYDHGNPETWDAFIAHITGRTYGGIIHRFPWPRILHNLFLLPQHIIHEINPLLFLSSLAGLILLATRKTRGFILFLLVVLGHLYLYIKDWSAAFGYIPIFLLAALLGSLGLAWLWSLAGERPTLRLRRRGMLVLAGLVFISASWGLGENYAYCYRADHDLTQWHGRAILSSLPDGAVLVGYQDHLAYNVFYQQIIERWRPDVQFVHRAWLPYVSELRRRFPGWDFKQYQPDQPLAAQRLLMENAKTAGAFWDYGWEKAPWIDADRLIPHGLVYRLSDQTWDGEDLPADTHLWRSVFYPIYSSPMVAPRGYDWTAQEVYSRAFHLRAKLHADARRWPQAETAEIMALRIRPDFAENHAYLGLALMAQKKYDLARAQFERSIRLDPLCVACLAGRGQLLVKLGADELALQDYRKALALDSSNVPAAIAFARLTAQRNRWAETIATAEHALPVAQSAEQALTLNWLAAMSYVELGKCRSAEAYLRSALALQSDFPPALKLAEVCGMRIQPK